MEPKSLKYLKWGFVCRFFHLKIAGIDLLPDFVGAWLLYTSIQSHKQTTEVEDRIKFLFLVLAADYFLHWIFPFDFILENLIMAVISMYAKYVLLGEVAARVRESQPEKAKQLIVVRMLTVISQVVNFVVSAYGNEELNTLLAVISVGILIGLLVVVCGIQACEEEGADT